ncbi:hypothetical protein FQN60_013570 [Etheostoma spectabile]|uniref:Uncharacterized protein n=1 Tax=Etheostoma spectabile TaxID=54343 RepID=A0A5J5CFB3_9PERO|nr:hypothetical protein FQN60_013570 [Etheostoma spectabile]
MNHLRPQNIRSITGALLTMTLVFRLHHLPEKQPRPQDLCSVCGALLKTTLVFHSNQPLEK